ncbi:MAG: translocation/assembly module TamB domain-containing protein [Acidobacteriota bacterium]
MRRKLVKVLLWVSAALLAAMGAVVLLALFTPLPDRIAQELLVKAVRRSGGTLTIARREGRLVKGLDLYGVSFSLPGRVTFTAQHLHARLSVLPLGVGIIRLTEVLVEGPDLDLTRPAPGKGPASASRSLPRWLNVWVPRFQVRAGRFSWHGRPAAAPLLWSGISAGGSATLSNGSLHLALASLEAGCPAPLPFRLRASGGLAWSAGGGGRFDGEVSSALSRVKGLVSLKADGSFSADLSFAPLALREAAVGWAAAPDLSVTGSARVEGRGGALRWKARLDAKGLGPVSSEGSGEMASGRVHLQGTAATEGASLNPFWKTPAGREAQVAGTANWSVDGGRGSLRWKADGELGASRIWGLSLRGARVKAEGSAGEGSLSAEGEAAMAGSFKGSLSWGLHPRRWRAELAGEGVDLQGVLTSLSLMPALPAGLHPPQGPWRVKALSLGQEAAQGFTLSAKVTDPKGGEWSVAAGPLGSGRPVVWSAAVTSFDPSLWGLGPAGRLVGRAAFRGPSAREGLLELDLGSGQWDGVAFSPLAMRLHLSPSGTTLEPATLTCDLGTARIGGTLSSDGRLRAEVKGEVRDAARLGRLFGVEGLAGDLKADVRLAGPWKDPSVEGTASVEGGGYGTVKTARLEVSGRWGGTGAASDLTLSYAGLRASETDLGDGSVVLRGLPARAEVSWKALLPGKKNLSFRVSGALLPPRMDLRVSDILFEIAGKRFAQEGEARVEWTRESLAWSGLVLVKQKSRLEAEGRLDLRSGFAAAPMQGRVSAVHLPLALLPLPRTAGSMEGFLAADLSWSGRLDAPQISGTAELTEGSYTYPESDLTIAPITLAMKAKGDRLVLTRGTATTPEGGRAEATGYLQFRGFLPASFDFSVAAKAFPFVVGRQIDGLADVRAGLSGSIEKPVISGQAQILKGKIELPDLAQQQPLPSTVRFVNVPKGFALGQEEQGQEAPMVGRLRGQVVLSSQGGLWASNRNLLAEVTGQITVRLTDKGPAVGGRLNLQQGRYLFEGKKFTIQESSLNFDGTTSLVPYLDITALYKAGSTDITVHITGSPSHPNLTLTSDPPMEKADILATLLFGRPLGDLNAGERSSWSNAAAGMAVQYQAAPLLEALRGKLGLDTLTVGASSTGQGTEVGFSKYLGDRTVLEYQQIFGTLPEERINLRYRVNRHLSLQSQVSTNGESGGDVLWEQRY